jgi:hypothetical protein
LDGRVIVLHGPTFWFLVAPADLVEEFAHMIAMISHSQLTFDQSGNSLSGPQLGSVSMGHRPLGQETNNLPSLFQSQSGRPSWRWLGFKCLLSTGLEGIAPPHNATCMATDAPANLMKRQLQLQEPNHTAPTLFQQFRRTFRSHQDTPIQDVSIILHYLCGGQ